MLGSTSIVDGKTDGRTDGWTENWTAISHLAKAGATKMENSLFILQCSSCILKLDVANRFQIRVVYNELPVYIFSVCG